MITLDGSFGEGGGALVRTALALSALTGQEFKVINIRANRPERGLKAQHLEAIKALQQMCRAETSPIEIGSTEFWFQPGKIRRGEYSIDIGTAGSITLLLQALILPSLFAPGKVTFHITGGTCGKWQASVDYLQNLLLPHLQRFVEKIELKIIKRGYYPAGGGVCTLEISPRFKLKDFSSVAAFLEELEKKVADICLEEQGKLEQIRGVANISIELGHQEVGERIAQTVEVYFKKYQVPVNIRVEYAAAKSVGGEIVIWGIFSRQGKVDYDNPVMLAGDALLEKNKSAEAIGREAAEELEKEIQSGAAVDTHLADQLIFFMGLLPGSSIITPAIASHTQTNMYVTEQFLPVAFAIDKNKITAQKKRRDELIFFSSFSSSTPKKIYKEASV